MKAALAALAMSGAAVLGLVSSAAAHQEVVGKLTIGHPWVRAAPAGSAGTYACIIEIKNDGDEPETLLGASIEGAGKGVIYQIIEKDGKFSSKPVEHGLVIKPHGSIELSPSTYQIRFGKITSALTDESMVAGTLEFEKLKNVPVHFMVEPDDTAPKEEPALGQ
ncbi:MAG: copper chaperone PCu(A)C [Beijerinckiaceae bacterium]|nr:copper chaperone PCu(A)C [Beijerinckiaceae bacterium]